MTDISNQIASVTDEKPVLTVAGTLIRGASWALVKDRVTVKVVKTNSQDTHPFQKIQGIPERPVVSGHHVPEKGYAVVRVTGHEAFTHPGVPCDQWGNMLPRPGGALSQ